MINLLKVLIVPVLLSISGITACTMSPSSGSAGVGGFNLVSVEEEKQLGDKFAVEIEKQYKVVNDQEVQAYINRVGHKLLKGVRKVEFPYSFKVVEDKSLNAFAIPGGHTYVNTGLIKAAESEDELAAVMAHEINHVVSRHSTEQMTKQYGYQILTGLLLGTQGDIAKVAADLFGKAGLLYYSREMESEADYLGVETMYKAGYDPRGMASFFKKLQAQSKSNPGSVAKFFSTHPATEERIRDIEAQIAKLPPKNFTADSPEEFRRVKARLEKF